MNRQATAPSNLGLDIKNPPEEALCVYYFTQALQRSQVCLRAGFVLSVMAVVSSTPLLIGKLLSGDGTYLVRMYDLLQRDLLAVTPEARP
jgi:hypothetical protein